MKPLLIFDHDGTLHNTTYIYEPAMRKAISWLVSEGWMEERNVTAEEINSCLGMNIKECWKHLCPDLGETQFQIASKMVGEELQNEAAQGKGRWYPGAAEVLDALKAEEYPMVILSNCHTRLADAYWKAFHMERWIQHFYDCETYNNIPKPEIARIVLKEHPGPAIFIGDRKSDQDCAKTVGMPFVGCAYGFGESGELAGADAVANTPEDLLTAIHLLTKEKA